MDFKTLNDRISTTRLAAKVSYGLMCGSALAFAPMPIGMVVDGEIGFGTSWWIAAMAAVVGFTALASLANWVCRTKIDAHWDKVYVGQKWMTPAGEQVTVKSTSRDGKVFHVEFEDGYPVAFGQCYLEPVEKAKGGPKMPNFTSNEPLFARVAKTPWKTLDGQRGVVRSAERIYEDGDGHSFIDYIVLKLDSGEVAKFERADLQPA